jgi:hypothetical protein
MIEFNSYSTGIQVTSLALSRVEGAPHKPFGLEPFGFELKVERLRAERFTPPDDLGIFDMAGVHHSIHPTGKQLRCFACG